MHPDFKKMQKNLQNLLTNEEKSDTILEKAKRLSKSSRIPFSPYHKSAYGS